MAARRTDRTVAGLRDLARAQSNAAPPGYEHYGVDWGKLTPRMRAVVCAFADVLKEVREHEVDLLRLGTVDRIRALTAELRRQAAEMAAERNARAS